MAMRRGPVRPYLTGSAAAARSCCSHPEHLDKSLSRTGTKDFGSAQRPRRALQKRAFGATSRQLLASCCRSLPAQAPAP
jgi:hypothetical protein